MSRKLIISLLVVLILGILGGTIALVINRLRSSANPTDTITTNQGTLQQSETGSQQIVDPTGDDDGDGLSNADEIIWGTDRNNPDTDGDGFKDGTEVAAGHNPSIPAPNDKLPNGFVPGKNLQPLDSAPSEPLAVDQFFSDNLDLTGGNKNYTDDYNSKYPEADRTNATLISYAKAQPVVTQLPTPADKAIQQQPADSPALLRQYLTVAGNTSYFSNRPLFNTAINNLFERGDASTIRGVAAMIRIHQDSLINTKVPPQGVALQKLLLGYTELLAATLDQMAQYNQDSVKAVVAMQQWSEIDKKYVPLIEQEVNRLTSLNASLASN